MSADLSPPPGSSPADVSPQLDAVASAVLRVETELKKLRADGRLPEFPSGELERQFNGVVEAVESRMLEPRVDAHHVRASSEYFNGGDPGAAVGGGPLRRLVVRITSRWTGLILPRLGTFTSATATAVEQLAERQDNLQQVIVAVQLDRIRSLEYRCAQLELEIEKLAATNEDPEPNGS